MRLDEMTLEESFDRLARDRGTTKTTAKSIRRIHGKVVFETNVPQTVALEFANGKRVESRYDDYEMYYSITDGRALYASPALAERIAAVEPQAGQPLVIVKKEIREGNKKRIEWQVSAEEQPEPVTRPAAPVTTAKPQRPRVKRSRSNIPDRREGPDEANIPEIAKVLAPDRPNLAVRLAAAVVRAWKDSAMEFNPGRLVMQRGVEDLRIAGRVARILGDSAIQALASNPYILVPLFSSWTKLDEFARSAMQETRAPGADVRRGIGQRQPRGQRARMDRRALTRCPTPRDGQLHLGCLQNHPRWRLVICRHGWIRGLR